MPNFSPSTSSGRVNIGSVLTESGRFPTSVGITNGGSITGGSSSSSSSNSSINSYSYSNSNSNSRIASGIQQQQQQPVSLADFYNIISSGIFLHHRDLFLHRRRRPFPSLYFLGR